MKSLRSYLVLFQDDAITRREGALERPPVLGYLLQLGSYTFIATTTARVVSCADAVVARYLGTSTRSLMVF
jgi:hypothetical protein